MRSAAARRGLANQRFFLNMSTILLSQPITVETALAVDLVTVTVSLGSVGPPGPQGATGAASTVPGPPGPSGPPAPTGGAHVHAVSPTLNRRINNSFLQFDAVDFDSAGFVAGALPVDRLTIPPGEAGLYVISVQADTASSLNNANQAIVLTINGTIGIAKADSQVQGTLGCSLNLVGIWRLNAGDYVQAQYRDSAPNVNGQFNIAAPGTPALALALVG